MTRRHQRKTADGIQGTAELLGQGAGHHHGETGAGEATRANGDAKPDQLIPMAGRQQLLDGNRKTVGELPAGRPDQDPT